MPLIYTLVKRPDMSKGAAEGATLYHAQTSITKKLTLNSYYKYNATLFHLLYYFPDLSII